MLYYSHNLFRVTVLYLYMQVIHQYIPVTKFILIQGALLVTVNYSSICSLIISHHVQI